MASKFEELLVELAGQVRGTERLLQAAAQREETLVREIGLLREKVAKLEKGEEYTGEERRKVDQRLGTGDHTFERLKYEVKRAEDLAEEAGRKSAEAAKTAQHVLSKVEELRKSITRKEQKVSSRWWFVVKTVLQYAIPLIVSGIGTLVTFYFAKGRMSP